MVEAGGIETRSREISVRKGGFYADLSPFRVPLHTGFYRLPSPGDSRVRGSQRCRIGRFFRATR